VTIENVGDVFGRHSVDWSTTILALATLCCILYGQSVMLNSLICLCLSLLTCRLK